MYFLHIMLIPLFVLITIIAINNCFQLKSTGYLRKAMLRHHYVRRPILDIYYEALDLDSKTFIVKEVLPVVHKNISKFISFNLNPYGKTKITKDNATEYKFTCQQGPNQCIAAKYHVCGLAKVDNGTFTKGYSFNINSVDYVGCMMEFSGTGPPEQRVAPIEKCKGILGDQSAMIEKCASGLEGDNLLAEFGMFAHIFQNPIETIPTVVYREHYKKAESDAAIKDLLGFLCFKFRKYKIHDCLDRNLTEAKLKLVQNKML